jgi:predicted transcriptional regulator
MPFNKKLIPKVIIVALLINFSMFFTKAIIDVSNIVAFEFYKTAQSIGNSTPIPYFPDVKSGLTASIMNGLQVQQIVNDQGKVAIAVTNPTYEFFSVLFAIVVVLVATFVLLVMATLLLIRFILFLFLIITSPVAFVGFLLPQLKSQADKWWKTLSAQAVFAPVFFILMLIVMLIINDPSFHNFLQTLAHSGTATNEASAAQYIANITAIALQYTIVIALLILALISAKQLSGGAAGWAAKLGGKASGIGAFALRNSVGKLGGRIVRSEALGSLVKSDSMVGRAVGKSLILGGNQLQTRSFDARGVKAFGSYAEGSVAQKGGLVGAQKARQERIEARGKIYTQGIASREQREEIAQLRGELADVTQGENETPEKFADRKRKLEEKLALAENTLLEIQGKLTPEREKLLEETQKLSDAERKEADSIISAIEAQQEAISRFKDQAKMGIAGASAKAADAEGKLETFRDRELKGKKFEAYVNIRENVNKIQKGASKARSGAERAYGEIVSGGIFKSTRAAGDALRKGKEKPEDTIAKEVMKALKESTAPTAEAPTTTSATTATPSPGGGESPRAGKEL